MRLTKPKVLLVTTRPWVAAARIALAFRDNGCDVSMVCPRNHPIRLTSLKDRVYRYSGLAPLGSLRSAVAAFQPDFVIPCDDLSHAHLNALHVEESTRNSEPTPLLKLIEFSLGDSFHRGVGASRSALFAIAREEDVPTPETRVISSLVELRSWIHEFGLPVVLKTDGTSGGTGTRIIRTEDEVEKALRDLGSPQRMDQAIKRALVDSDTTLLMPWLKRKRAVVNAQQFLPYPDANIAVAAWRGKILASISVEVLRTTRPTGPSSLVRLIEHPGIYQAAEKLTRRLGLSGIHGFDFLIERSTGKAWLIEMNPRATQTCYLPLGKGHDLPAALAATLCGMPVPESTSITDRDVIALFPMEWLADSTSKFLTTAYHDVPWSEPKLVEAGVASRLRKKPWLTYENLDRILSHLQFARIARRFTKQHL